MPISDFDSAREMAAWAEAPLDRAERDLLALIAGSTPSPKSRRSDEDSKELVDLLLRSWNILPSISDSLFGELAVLLPKQELARIARAWLAVTAFVKAQIAACLPFVRALDRSGLNYALLKGSAMSFLAPEPPVLRAGWDFDVGVAYPDLKRAEALAAASGFWPAEYVPSTKQFVHADSALRAQVEAQHYELGFFVRRLEVTNLSGETIDAIRTDPWTQRFWFGAGEKNPWCYAVLDIHHAISRDIGLDELLAEAGAVIIGGDRLRLP